MSEVQFTTTVGITGWGDIAKNTAKTLKEKGVNVVVFVRDNGKAREGDELTTFVRVAPNEMKSIDP